MAVRGAEYPRQANDYYCTPVPPVATLLNAVRFNQRLCDPCCGGGHMLRTFEQFGYTPLGFDIAPWGHYPKLDFLNDPFPYPGDGWGTPPDIATNPPFGKQGRLSMRFIARALEVTNPWQGKVAMLLPADFDSGKTRQHVFKGCQAFKHRIVLLDRIKWFNERSGEKNFSWFVWDWTNRQPPTVLYG